MLGLAARAWRRPLTSAEQNRLRKYYRHLRSQVALDHRQSIRALLTRVLVAPEFIYRAERGASERTHPLNDWELASRLSFLLWSSLPDTELRRAAAAGELSMPAKLAAQTRRMLDDPKSRRFSAEFFGQWLGFYRFDQYRGVDAKRFPEFSPSLKKAMHREAVSFFDHIVRRNRPADEILFADYTFLNQELAVHYGVEASLPNDAAKFVKIEDAGRFHRGGLLRLGAVLTATSAPLRTSPVKRGDWVLRRVLGNPVPPPPADAGSIPADDALGDGLSVRQRLEAHRRDAACVNCHSRIDPLGFALEKFDPLGRWREVYRDGQPIETAGVLRSGERIGGDDSLHQYLATQKGAFHRALSGKLLAYALGRSSLVGDVPLLKEMTGHLRDGGSLRGLVEKIVVSRQFRYHGSSAGRPGPLDSIHPSEP